MKRQEIFLTKDERKIQRNLRSEPDAAFAFWENICRSRNLDSKTILPDPETNRPTALAKGHSKHWCWPYPLVCKDPPEKQLQYLKLDD